MLHDGGYRSFNQFGEGSILCRAAMVVVSAALLSFFTVGCQNEQSAQRDEASQTITEAARQASTFVPAETHLTIGEESSEYRDEQFKGLSSKVGSGEGLPAQVKAMQSLQFEAALGRAHVALEELRRAEAEFAISASIDQNDFNFVDPAAAIHQQIDKALSQQASIGGLQKISLVEAFRSLDAKESATRQERTELAGRLETTQARIADLSSKAKAERQLEADLREQSADVKSQIPTSALEQRIALIERAAAISREADSHAVKAANFEATLDTVRPEESQINSLIEQCDLILGGMSSARADLQARERAIKAEVAARTIILKQHVANVDAMTKSFADARTAQITPRQATAVEAAREAVNAARSGGEFATSVAQQALGAAHWEVATSQAAYAALAARMAQHADLLGRGDQDAVLAEQLNAEATAARAAAAEAYNAGVDALQGVSESPQRDAILRLMKVSADLAAGSLGFDAARDALAVAEKESNDASDAAGDEQSTSSATGEDIEAVRALFREAVAKVESGDVAGFFAMVEQPDDEAGRRLLALAQTSEAAWSNLNTACYEKFNQTVPEILNDPSRAQAITQITAGNPMLGPIVDNIKTGGASSLSAMAKVDWNTVEFTFDAAGNTASIDNVPNVDAFAAVRREAGWRLALNVDNPIVAAIASSPEAAAMMNGMTTAFDRTAERTRAGEFALPELMIAAFLEEFGKALSNFDG